MPACSTRCRSSGSSRRRRVSAIAPDQITQEPVLDHANDASGKGGVQGTGPFKVTGYTAGQFMELSRNDGLLARHAEPRQDRPQGVQGPGDRADRLRQGRDRLDLPDRGRGHARAGQCERDGSSPVPRRSTTSVVFNPTGEPGLRASKQFQAGDGVRDRPRLDHQEPVQRQGHDADCLFGNPAYARHGTETYDYNPDKAKELIAAGGDRPVDRCPTFTFDTYYNDPLSLNVMTAIQQNWADIGFKVKIQQMDPAAWTKQYYNDGKSQISFIGAQNGPDGNIAATYFLSTADYAGRRRQQRLEGLHLQRTRRSTTLHQAGQLDLRPGSSEPTIYQAAVQRPRGRHAVEHHVADDPLLASSASKIGNFFLTPAPGGGSYYDAAEQWYIKLVAGCQASPVDRSRGGGASSASSALRARRPRRSRSREADGHLYRASDPHRDPDPVRDHDPDLRLRGAGARAIRSTRTCVRSRRQSAAARTRWRHELGPGPAAADPVCQLARGRRSRATSGTAAVNGGPVNTVVWTGSAGVRRR